MARIINYEELEVGKTYWIQLRYWGTIEEVTVIKLNSNKSFVEAQREPGNSFMCDPDWDWFWSEKPTLDEQNEKRQRPYSYFGS